MLPWFRGAWRGWRKVHTDPSERRLAGMLGLPASQLGAVRFGRRYYYRPTVAGKPDGRTRQILAPSPELKRLQRALLKDYLSELPVHAAAQAFRKGGSTLANARLHLGRAVLVTVDLEDFFEATSADRVREFFVRQGWRGLALDTLMRLCTYKGGLPQGAPTSPLLSNLVNFELDQALSDLARLSGARYSRYADDLAFSWRVAMVPGAFIAQATTIFDRFGYAVQLRKGWRVQTASHSPQINGIVLKDGRALQPPARLRWRALVLHWRWRLTGDPHLAAQLRGYEGYLRSFDS